MSQAAAFPTQVLMPSIVKRRRWASMCPYRLLQGDQKNKAPSGFIPNGALPVSVCR
jgi:hypothetical protein